MVFRRQRGIRRDARNNRFVGLAVRVILALACLGDASFHEVGAPEFSPVETRTKVIFAPDRKIVSLVHDWTFDPAISLQFKREIKKPDEMATREMFSDFAMVTADKLARQGYFTTLEIDGNRVDFLPMKEYWMEERADHLVAFHAILPLKTPTRLNSEATLVVVDVDQLLDMKVEENSVSLESAPPDCRQSLEYLKRPEPRFSKPAKAWIASGGWAPRVKIVCPLE